MKLLLILLLSGSLFSEIINRNQDYWVEIKDQSKEIPATFFKLYEEIIPANKIFSISEIETQLPTEYCKLPYYYYIVCFGLEPSIFASRYFYYLDKESAEKDRDELIYLWEKYK